MEGETGLNFAKVLQYSTFDPSELYFTVWEDFDHFDQKCVEQKTIYLVSNHPSSFYRNITSLAFQCTLSALSNLVRIVFPLTINQEVLLRNENLKLSEEKAKKKEKEDIFIYTM